MPEHKRKKTAAISNQPPEEQLQRLRRYLATSKPFSLCRGKLGSGWTEIGIFEELEKASPSGILDQYEWRHGQVRILMNKLATLRRDGHLAAYQELLLALHDDRFVITGEEWPLDKRRSGVLMIFDPDRMIDLIKWIQLLDPKIMDKHQDQASAETLADIERGYPKDRPTLRGFTEQILERNPDIKEGFTQFYASPRRNSSYRYSFFPSSLMDRYYKEWALDEDAIWTLRRHTEWLYPAERKSYQDEDILYNWGMACFFPDKTQAEVLGMFKREHQDKVATWQFHYPAHMGDMSNSSDSIGLFPERELSKFKRQWPTHVSGSLQHGMGAVLLEDRYHQTMDDPLFDPEGHRLQEQDPDKDAVGIRLRFKHFSD